MGPVQRMRSKLLMAGYRFEPYTIPLSNMDLIVWEDKCMCGSCDTVHVKTVDHFDGDTEHYTSEGPDATTLDVYDQVRYLKGIILDMAKLLKDHRAPNRFVEAGKKLLAMPPEELAKMFEEAQKEVEQQKTENES